jgi:hypothetical protein
MSVECYKMMKYEESIPTKVLNTNTSRYHEGIMLHKKSLMDYIYLLWCH